MRKTVFVLALAFILFSCDNENMNEPTNPLIGTWEWNSDGYIERFSFTENEVTMYYEDTYLPHTLENPSTDSGTYQYTDSHIIFEWEKMGISSADYIINANKLTLTHNRTNKVITYIKTD